MALGSTHPLTEMSTEVISLGGGGGKGGQCVGLTTLPPLYATVLKSGSLNLPELSGPVQACRGIAFALPCIQDRQGTYNVTARYHFTRTDRLYGYFNITENNKTCLRLHIKYPIFLSDFKHILCSQYQISRKSVQWEPS